MDSVMAIRRLLKAGLVVAAWGGLVGAAAADSDTRLVDAVKRQDRPAIAVLLKERIDVNATLPDGTTALHWAAYHDDSATVGALLRAGARANACS